MLQVTVSSGEKNMKKILLITSLSLVAVFSSGTYAGVNNAAYDTALKEAITAADKAKSVGGEWRDIRWKKSKAPLIPTAEKLAAKGEFEKAITMLKTAKRHAEKGYQQAIEQKNSGPRF